MLGERAYVRTRRRQARWLRPLHNAAPQNKLRVWQIETGQILRIVDLDPALAIGLEEDLDVVIDSNVEAQRHVDDINVARITIIVAVSNTERELPAAQR